MKFSWILLIFGLATACIKSTMAHAEPGCLSVIQGKAIPEQAAKLLPPSCREFRKSYLQSLKLFSKNPKKFSQDLSRQILAKKSFEPPYNAILISTFPKKISDELKHAIHSRAQLEQKKKFKFQYALAAEERILKGSCSRAFAEAAYDEICRGKDLVYSRIEALANPLDGVKR